MPTTTRRGPGRLLAALARQHWHVSAIAALAVFAVAVSVASAHGWQRWSDTIGLFFMEPPRGESDSLEVARLLAAVAVVLVAAKGILILFRSQADTCRARTSSSHVIVCGLGLRGSRLVEAFREKGHRVVAIEQDGRASAIQAARERGAFVVTGAATDPLVLERAGMRRARCVIAVGSDDATNIEVATTALGMARTDPHLGGGPDPRMIVQVEDDELVRALRASPSTSCGRYALEFVNISRRGAWPLLDHPTPLDADEGATPHLLVVGLGQLGEEVIVAAGLLWRKLSGPSGSPLRLTVVERSAEERIAHLVRRHPRLAECDLGVFDLEPEVDVLDGMDLLQGGAWQPVTRAYVCLDDPVRGLSVGLKLLRHQQRQRFPVVVSVRSEQESAGRFLEPGGPFEVGLHLFGLVEQTCTAELLLDTPVETVARLQHRDFLRDRLTAGQALGETPYLRPWEELTDAQKEDGREWARSVPSKLELVGAQLHELADWDVPLFEFSDAEVEHLAKVEHERWADLHRRNGWQYGLTRNDARKLHPDLVSWADLPEGSRGFDRNQVRHLPRQLARAGYEIRRAPRDAEAPTGDGGLVARDG